MMNSNSLIKIFLTLFASCLLTSCDGGIFGTGTGDDTLATTFPESTGSQNPASDNLVDATVIAHVNQTVGTTSDLPHINIINASDTTLSITNDTDNIPLSISTIAAGTFSNIASLSLNENNLNIIDASTEQVLVAIRPLTAVAGSLSTLFVFNNASMGIDVSILDTQNVNASATTALIRIIQAETLSAEDQNITFSLTPEGENPGSSAVDFPNVSVTTRAETNYQTIGAGDYVLVDPLNRITRSAVSVQAGRVYTLIVQSTESGDLLIHEDSRFQFQ